MKNLPLLVLVMGLMGPLYSKSPDYAALFGTRDGCFEMSQISSGKVVAEYNPKRCRERFSPCSSFKIAAALMAFEKGVIKDENQIIKWDGIHRVIPSHNQDQTPYTWMSNSPVWVTQWVTPQLTMPAIQKFLKDFSYGNQDFSGGITQAWLSSSLKISANEQVAFLTKFWTAKLPLSKRTVDLTKKIIFIKDLNPKEQVYGKTGSCCIDDKCMEQPGRMLGWFVGIIKTEKDAYAFAGNATDTKKESAPGGARLRESLIPVLSDAIK